VIGIIIAFTTPESKVFNVLIDAGHGGNDLGGITPTGLAEKDVNLNMGLAVGSALGKDEGVVVSYTRMADSLLPLEERSRAVKPNTDLLISFHTDPAESHDFAGITIHCPSQGRYFEASMAYAVRMAAALKEQGMDVRVRTRNRYYILNKVDCPALLISAPMELEGLVKESLWESDSVKKNLVEAVLAASNL